jgi:hypothetical protein
MNNSALSNYWTTVLTHEAGHAVAVLVAFNQTADIIVKRSDKNLNSPEFSGAYRWLDSQDGTRPDVIDPLSRIMVYAAGAKAEEICLSITQSSGFANDFRKVELVRSNWESKSDEDYWRKMKWPQDVIERCLLEVPSHRLKLDKINREIDSRFSRTHALISEHQSVLRTIASMAYDRLISIGESNLRDELVLLESDKIRKIWEDSKMKKWGHSPFLPVK